MAFQKSDGMNYAPQGKPEPVVDPGEFVFAAVALDHGHIYGQCNGLREAGGELRYVFDPDPAKVEKFCSTFAQVTPLRSIDEVLEKADVQLVTSAAVPNQRGSLGCRVMRAGKDYFTDKAPFTTLEQLAEASRVVTETGRKYMVYYSERLHVEAAVRAGQLIDQGAIGRVVQVIGLGPHRSNPPSRPSWFWQREAMGGILIDIGSHQFEQFLQWTGAKDVKVVNAAVANYRHKEWPEFEDWGEANLVGENGATNYVRVDWLNPNGLRTWGDGRTFILGTDGYMELRKYLNVAVESEGDHLFLVNHEGEFHIRCAGEVGYPVLRRPPPRLPSSNGARDDPGTCLRAAELSLRAQEMARRLE
jgi:predicted dehydrogenase